MSESITYTKTCDLPTCGHQETGPAVPLPGWVTATFQGQVESQVFQPGTLDFHSVECLEAYLQSDTVIDALVNMGATAVA